MTLLPRATLPKLYAQLMDEVKHRLASTGIALNAAANRDQETFAFLHLEFCYLQIRRAIELVAIGVLLLHNEIGDFRSRDFLKEWNAGLLFKKLESVSDDAFPEPATISSLDENGCANLFIGDAAAANRLRIAEIYALCGDKLHAGSLKGPMKGPKHYDAEEIVDWRSFLVRLLNHHVILLPGRTSMMTVFMANDDAGAVKCDLHDLEPGSIPIGTPHPNTPSK